ncbi:hypothetical protein NX02_20005 [Sphingomonas sanxanigenens DSM 19645 = NX02]|uniref:Uncharacterized protein n=1 Tax=Sphingomonas sanxanigenens DSM 19645 = NX02 TaxID=1123269 RepID=W0AJ24_9SPHN|nr:hypothetical protein NX02_20005 [Sphingomonas sanxanigenens DSM 19645 = NX02]
MVDPFEGFFGRIVCLSGVQQTREIDPSLETRSRPVGDIVADNLRASFSAGEYDPRYID